jgi:hypothetical protein
VVTAMKGAAKAATKMANSITWPPSLFPQQFSVLLLGKAQGGQVPKRASHEGGQILICWTPWGGTKLKSERHCNQYGSAHSFKAWPTPDRRESQRLRQ